MIVFLPTILATFEWMDEKLFRIVLTTGIADLVMMVNFYGKKSRQVITLIAAGFCLHFLSSI